MADKSLTHGTLHALQWSYLSTLANITLQIALTAILARLLTPGDFGLVAMATVALRFGQYFAQMGMGQAIVQKSELSPDDTRAAWTSSVVLGAAFASAFALAAPLVALLFNDPDVIPLVRVLSTSFLFTGMATTALALLRRSLRFASVGLIEVGSHAVAYVALGVTLAVAGAGAWSLVAAAVGQSVLVAAGAYMATRHSVRPSFSLTAYRRLYSFGTRVSLAGFLEYFCYNLDTFWAGRVLGPRAVGLYSRGFMLVSLPLTYMTQSFSRVLVPSFSRLQQQRRRLRDVYLPSLLVFLAVGFPAFWGLGAAARDVVRVLLGPGWGEAAMPAMVFAGMAPMLMSGHLAAALCEATATLNARVLIRGAQLILLAVLLYLLDGYSLLGIAVAVAVAEVLADVSYAVVVARVLECRVAAVLSTFRVGLLGGAVVAVAVTATSLGARAVGLSAFVALPLEVVVGALLALAVLLRSFDGIAWSEIGKRLDQPELAGALRLLHRLHVRLSPLASTTASRRDRAGRRRVAGEGQ